MSDQKQIAVCQRCGIGFLVTSHYCECVQRWGARVKVPQYCPRCFHQKGPLPKQRGTVQWFNLRKRYGFIVGERGERVFLHQNALLESNGGRPREGQVALYHVQYSAKGPEALNVELEETIAPRSRGPKER